MVIAEIATLHQEIIKLKDEKAELLEALRGIAQYWRIERNENHYCHRLAVDAIAKATGVQA